MKVQIKQKPPLGTYPHGGFTLAFSTEPLSLLLFPSRGLYINLFNTFIIYNSGKNQVPQCVRNMNLRALKISCQHL